MSDPAGDSLVYDPLVYSVIHITWGMVAMVCFLIGCPANFVTFSMFYRGRSHKASRALYLFMTFIDGMICGCGLIYGITGLFDNKPVCNSYRSHSRSVTDSIVISLQVILSNFVFCQIFGIAWYTLDRTSIFVLALFNVCRTVCMFRPFKTINPRSIIGKY